MTDLGGRREALGEEDAREAVVRVVEAGDD